MYVGNPEDEDNSSESSADEESEGTKKSWRVKSGAEDGNKSSKTRNKKTKKNY